MKIRSLTLSNFRCFGPDPVKIELDDFTTLIGANGAGKTAILRALVRMFGARPAERRLIKADFHLPSEALAEAISPAHLWLEVRIEFPPHEAESPVGIPQCFHQAIIDRESGSPYCLIRLEGKWTGTLRGEGEIEEFIYWIKPDGGGFKKYPMQNHERGNIKVFYVPATRDPTAQLRQAVGTLLYPVLEAVNWTSEVTDKAEEAAESIRTIIKDVPGMKELEKTIGEEWRRLQDFEPLREVLLQPLNPNFDSLLRNIDASFQKCDGSHTQPIERLSDGLRSLFYFALLGTRFDIEQEYIKALESKKDTNFKFVKEDLAVLAFFAIEEPENHLAPHYLTHIIGLLKRLAGAEYGRNQVLLTSQSVAILGRIDPEAIRHVRYNHNNCTANVKKLTLPSKADEAFKYVKEAVRAYPELYFAKAVVLGEGDSEAVVLPRIATALGNPLAEQFISFVPLGGRHVNHFWRLLYDLDIPHVTLLDLDREREGAYWLRAKYIIDQLMEYRKELRVGDFGLSQVQYDALTKYTLKDDIRGLLQYLEQYNVFFCFPLDLDFLLQRTFPEVYEKARLGQNGPQGLGTPKKIATATIAVLKSDSSTGDSYEPEEREAFVWYAYLFLSRSKPVTHIMAMSELEDQTIKDRVPPVLSRLINAVATA